MLTPLILTRTNFVLIDYENVQVNSLELLDDEHFVVRVFIGPKNTKLHKDLVLAMQRMGQRADYIEMEGAGANALDFHIAFYLGELTKTDPSAYFHVISRDTGFDPLIQHLRERKILITRSNSIEEIPCFQRAEIKDKDAIAEVPVSSPLPEPPHIAPINGNAVQGIDVLFRNVYDNISKRKTGKPRKIKTLKSTIKCLIGKDASEKTVETIYKKMIKEGCFKLNGESIVYTPLAN